MKQESAHKDSNEQVLIKALKSILKARQVSHAKSIAKEVLALIGASAN